MMVADAALLISQVSASLRVSKTLGWQLMDDSELTSNAACSCLLSGVAVGRYAEITLTKQTANN